MRRTLASILASAILTAAAITSATLPASAQTPVSLHQRTCAAFRAWDRHRTAGRLTALVIDSTHLGRSYLRADIGQLYADASSPSPKAATHLGDDATWVNQDCGG
jgi:hypothetical protein